MEYIAILYSEVMGYNTASFNKFISKYNYKLILIHWDRKKLSEYKFDLTHEIECKKRSEFKNSDELILFLNQYNLKLIFVSGWMDKAYVEVCKYYKRKSGINIVCGIDNQWKGTLRQRIGIYYFKFFLSSAFSHAFVAGSLQFQFAMKLGFNKDNIKKHLYSADTELFHEQFKINFEHKKINYPYKILFVGRFNDVKGIDILLSAYNKIPDLLKEKWSLTIIGNGPKAEYYKQFKNIDVKEFMQPKELAKEIQNYGLFCLPSRFEPYGVVIHEMAASGLPILSSDVCGANQYFLKNNGATFIADNELDLYQKLISFLQMSDEELIQYSFNSYNNSFEITPEIWANTFYQFINSDS